MIMLLHTGHPAKNKMDHAVRPFWWPKLIKDIQTKSMRFQSKDSGNSIRTQLPMTLNLLLTSDRKPKPRNPIGFHWTNEN